MAPLAHFVEPDGARTRLQVPAADSTRRPSPHRRLADMAVQALIDEAELTPKPALVDGRGSGAHSDLDLDLMRRSARSLHPGFVIMAVVARGSEIDRELRELLACIGRDAERAMLAATHGSNAHRGAIWLLGLLVAAAAQQPSPVPTDVATVAARIAAIEDRFRPALASNGAIVGRLYGVRGARGEAEDGFPHVVAVGLPALRRARQAGQCEQSARLDALLSIMAVLDDTCLLHRGGLAALQIAQRGAADTLGAGGSSLPAGQRRLLALDAALVACNASPGGAADLLAASLFLDRLERSTPVHGDPSARSTSSDMPWKP